MACNCDISDVLKYDSTSKILTLGPLTYDPTEQTLTIDNKVKLVATYADINTFYGQPKLEGDLILKKPTGTTYAGTGSITTDGAITSSKDITATGSVLSTDTLYVGSGADNMWTPGGVITSTSYVSAQNFIKS